MTKDQTIVIRRAIALDRGRFRGIKIQPSKSIAIQAAAIISGRSSVPYWAYKVKNVTHASDIPKNSGAKE